MSQSQPEPRFTYGDYVQWDGDERWELIDGAAFLMTPAPSVAHQRVVAELTRQIGNQLVGHPCQVFVAPFDVRLPEADEADEAVRTVVQPDVVVLCDPSRLDEAGCRGAPDWVIEVLSPRTAARDRVEKRDLYERHGVREYWIVDPNEGVVEVFRRGEEGFEGLERWDKPVATESSALPGVRVEWAFA